MNWRDFFSLCSWLVMLAILCLGAVMVAARVFTVSGACVIMGLIMAILVKHH